MRIALIGAGQIGGSLALALKQPPSDCTIAVYDSTRAHAEALLARGGADIVAEAPEAAVADADIIIFACPLGAYRPTLARIAPVVKPGAILTDVGSVKGTLTALAEDISCVPAHPIAGSEKSGPEAAVADLFRGRLCVLTPDDSTPADTVRAIETLWHAAGADVIHMPTTVHDQIYAHVSHLPHLIAFATASHLFHTGVTLTIGDSNIRQFLRISTSPPRMWCDVALANREMLLPALSTYIAVLGHFASELRAGEPSERGVDKKTAGKTLLPRIIASSLISAISLYEQQSGNALRPFAGAGLRDIIAPAAITPEDDTEAIAHAAHTVADHLDGLIARLKQLEALIGAEDEPALLAMLNQMREDAVALISQRN